MKILISLVISMFLSVSVTFANAKNGKKVFKEKYCTTCHKVAKDQLKIRKGPSLQHIARKYKADGKQDSLIKFLIGKRKPIVAPDKFHLMSKHAKRAKKNLTKKERRDIADYILSN